MDGLSIVEIISFRVRCRNLRRTINYMVVVPRRERELTMLVHTGMRLNRNTIIGHVILRLSTAYSRKAENTAQLLDGDCAWREN